MRESIKFFESKLEKKGFEFFSPFLFPSLAHFSAEEVRAKGRYRRRDEGGHRDGFKGEKKTGEVRARDRLAKTLSLFLLVLDKE